ncbi:MAG TPA: holo-ACP synthase [bacterium]|nr:holo-ACP synthase [bacterium]
MIIGLGIDQIEIARVARSWQKYGDRFGRRVFTDAEWAYCLSRPHPAESMAGRFAAKEAAMKALGLGWPGGIAWRDIEITREPTGKPGLRFFRKAELRAARLGVTHTAVSMTHDLTYSSATVVFEKD